MIWSSLGLAIIQYPLLVKDTDKACCFEGSMVEVRSPGHFVLGAVAVELQFLMGNAMVVVAGSYLASVVEPASYLAYLASELASYW